MEVTPSPAPAKKKWYKRKSVIITAVVLIVIGMVTSAGKKDNPADAALAAPETTSAPASIPATNEAPATTETPVTNAPTTTEEASAPESESSQPDAASPSDTGANPFGGDSPEDSLMPDVICMNLQDAQNEIQDHGVILSRSVDATGEGRNQIIDSNWVVVGQSPAAGTTIGELDAELSVVKYGETTQCG